MKCKNIECQNETKGKNVYCCNSCRNYYVNKYMRDYTKCSNTFKEKKEEKERKYLENPKHCIECDEIILFLKKDNSFCSSSCSVKHTNKNRTVTWGNKISKSLQKYFDSEECVKNNTKQDFKICLNCSNKFQKNKLFCSIECKREYERNNMDSLKKYRADCNFNFNLADYKDEFDFSLVEQYGWYSPSNKKNNLGGVSRDHMFSVKDGFELNIDPKILSHPANCQLLIHSKNVSKHRNSSIALEELMKKIEEFNKKYNGV
jgi:hypothetical protein